MCGTYCVDITMNERIAKFTEQCYEYNETMQGTWFNKTKFAELIIRECVAICKDTDGEDNIDARSGRQDCAVEIREHFGVE